MTSRTRPMAAVLLLAPLAFGCGKKEGPPAATAPPSSPAAGIAATAVPPATAAVSPVAPAPAGTAAVAVAASTRPPTTTVVPSTTPTAHAAPPPAQPKAATPAPPKEPEPPPTTQAAAPRLATRPRPKGKITLPAKLGAVTFDHEKHAGKMKVACATCHHPSRPQQPLEAEDQACRNCHTSPATPPMKTSLQAAFHDPKGGSGTCIDCHKQSVAKGTPAPAKCLECHKKS